MPRALACIVAGLLFAASAAAHRARIPVTSISWNARLAAWEVVHRVSVHDMDAAFEGEADLKRLYETDEGIAQIGNYAAEAFAVSGRKVVMNYIGAELDGDQVFVYFEMKAPDQTLLVDSNLLFGAGETSFAHVNVTGAGGVASYVFGAEDGAKRVVLKRPR